MYPLSVMGVVVRSSIVGIALALPASGCDRDETKRFEPSPTPAPIESLAHAVGGDAAALVAPVDPPLPPGDLHDDIAAFVSVERCANDHTAVDPLVADALSAIGYDTFLRDACRVLDAAKAGDTRKCAPIEASSLRARCEATVAMIRGDAEACPWVNASEAERGRDPTCVAVALHDPRLCAAAEGEDTPRCNALTSRDPKKCVTARDEAARRACAREAARFRTSLADPPAALTAWAKPSGKLALTATAGSPEPSPSSFDLTSDVDHGVVLAREPLGTRLRVGSLVELGGAPHAVSPNGTARIGLELVVPSDVGVKTKGADLTAPRLDRAELDIPGSATIPSEGLTRALHVTIEKLDPTRGGEVRLRVEGEAGIPPRAYRTRIEIVTFVRDVVGGAGRAR